MVRCRIGVGCMSELRVVWYRGGRKSVGVNFQTYIHTYTYSKYKHTCIHTYIYIYMYTKYIHIYIHT